MEPKVLYEDEYLMVIDKPSGMVVNNSETAKNETVESWLANNFQFTIFAPSPKRLWRVGDNFQLMRHGIVHRLDKETSGVLLIAKTPEAFQELQRQFKEREVEKTYIALVHGKVVPEEGSISAPVGRLPWNRERFGVLPGGREAETRYKTIFNLQFSRRRQSGYGASATIYNERFTLLELFPKTGRTHQIRVHLKSIGHAIVGDEFYAGRKTARADRKWCPRLFLHAQSLSFNHPKKGARMNVEAGLPEDLTNAIKVLDSA